MMRVFSEVAKHNSFIAASEHLNISPPAVTRAVAKLEEQLEVKLFKRTTRQVRLTETGHDYLIDVKRILGEVERAEDNVTGGHRVAKGTINVTAPLLFGKLNVMPVITEFLAHYSQITIKTNFSDQVSSLIEEELDVAVRIGHLKNSNLYAKQVGRVRRIVCASPNYLDITPSIKSPHDLVSHTIIFPTTYESSPTWHFKRGNKREMVKLSPRLFCNENSSAIEAALKGFGIIKVMSYQVGQYIKKGMLVPILTEFEETALPVSILSIEGRNKTAKIKAFTDLLTLRLQENPFILHD